MQPIQLGIVGLGPRGRSLSHFLKKEGSERFQITALCDRQSRNLEQVLRELELPAHAGAQDFQELLQNPSVEAVMVQTDAQSLAPLSIAALRAGKHVICDVPMIFTREEAFELVEAVEESGLVYCMAEQVRFANFAHRWKEHIDAGDIGEPLFLRGEYFHPVPGWYYERMESSGVAEGRSMEDPAKHAGDPAYRKAWRNTFKHVIKYLSHELSPLLKIIDDRVTEVTCLAADGRSFGDLVEMLDMECAMMRTARGRVIQIVNSFTVPRYENDREFTHHWYHITGTHGFMENARPRWPSASDTQGWLSQELLCPRSGETIQTQYGWNRSDSPWQNFSGGHGGLEAFVFEEFYDAIRRGGKNECNIYNAVEAVLPGIVAAESVEAGGALLKVPNLRPGSPDRIHKAELI